MLLAFDTLHGFCPFHSSFPWGKSLKEARGPLEGTGKEFSS